MMSRKGPHPEPEGIPWRTGALTRRTRARRGARVRIRTLPGRGSNQARTSRPVGLRFPRPHFYDHEQTPQAHAVQCGEQERRQMLKTKGVPSTCRLLDFQIVEQPGKRTFISPCLPPIRALRDLDVSTLIFKRTSHPRDGHSTGEGKRVWSRGAQQGLSFLQPKHKAWPWFTAASLGWLSIHPAAWTHDRFSRFMSPVAGFLFCAVA